MGRPAEGWRLHARGAIFWVRFTHQGARHEESTGERDPGKARARAAEIYARVVHGALGGGKSAPVVSARVPLIDLVALWIEAIETTHSEGTRELYEIHMRRMVEYFQRLDRVVEGSIGAYCRARLGEVLRSTVRKERSTLAGFLAWCKEQGVISAVPAFPKLPRGAIGKPATQRKSRAVELTPAQVQAFLDALPEHSPGIMRGGSDRVFAVRAYFVVMWETALRPSTLEKLSVPEHYRRGAGSIFVARAIDKGRYERTIPITPAATAALDSVITGPGLIFGVHDYRTFVRDAAKAAGMPKGFSPYDLRHARATDWAAKDLRGAGYLLGHRRLTTTAIYAKATEAAARVVLGSGTILGQKNGAATSEVEDRRSAKGGT